MGEAIPGRERSPKSLDLRSGRGFFTFSLAAAVFLLGGNTIHGFVHEVLGHGLSALGFGMQFDGFYIGAFGINLSYFSYPSLNISLYAIQDAAGSLVSAVAGFALFFLVYPWAARKSFGARLFVLLLCVNLETDLLYPFLSPILSYGDAYSITQLLGVSPPWVFSLVMAPVAIVGYYPLLKEYFGFLLPYLSPVAGFPRRALALIELVFAPTLLYWAITLAVLFPLSGVSAGVSWGEGVALGAVLLVPTGLAVAGRTLGVASDEGDSNADYLSMRRYLLVSLALVLVVTAVFGPTANRSWGVSWGPVGGSTS
ncbi:MAG: hypothetical protein JRN08_03625 [Nitrososphaerota archaeon]|nr:hypothetical protein [Nitrososphaerota archaeon]